MSLIDPLALINDFKKNNLFNKAILSLIFLFPILSLSVRHWLSGIFSLLALFSLYYLFVNRKKLCSEEKILFLIFFAFILSFLFSATINDWSLNSIRRTGTEFKYLLFFPLYLMLRQYNQLRDILLYGTLLGGMTLGVQAIYDIFIASKLQAWGIYGPIIFGDLSVLFFSISCIVLIYNKKIPPYLIIISILLSLLAGYFSGSRNAWIALVTSVPIILLFSWHNRVKKQAVIAYVIVLLSVSLIAVISVTSIKNRAVLAYNQLDTFIKYGAEDDQDLLSSSVGFRLEQWRAALQIFQDAPYFGFGGGNASKQVNRHVEKGLAHKDLYNPKVETGIGGLHSTYFDTLVNEGIIGLSILFLFLFYPLYVFIKFRKYDPLSSSIGIILIVNYMIFGISENPFIHDNFTSVYLIYLAVFFSSLVREKHKLNIE